jgi:hypothetical protein
MGKQDRTKHGLERLFSAHRHDSSSLAPLLCGRSGAEFGIGPNVTPIGVGLVVAGGVTVRSGALHVPLTFAVATSKTGARVTILTGFNLRRR